MLRKVERAHIGEEPRRVTYEEEKILSKVEKRILKTLKKADRASAREVCKNNIFDAIRYSMNAKYGYKKRFSRK